MWKRSKMRSKLLDIMLKRVPIQRTKVASGKSDFPNRQFLVQVLEEKPLNGTQLTFGLIWATGLVWAMRSFFSSFFSWPLLRNVLLEETVQFLPLVSSKRDGFRVTLSRIAKHPTRTIIFGVVFLVTHKNMQIKLYCSDPLFSSLSLDISKFPSYFVRFLYNILWHRL